MSGLTLRERAEKKLAEASEFELRLENVEASADDIKQLETLANEAGELFRQVQSQAQASGTIKEANEFFRSVGLNGPAEDGETAKMQAMSGQSGIALPTGAMSMGDAFLASPAYQEMLKFTDAGGSSLSDQWVGTSPKYSVPEQAIDQNGMIQNALITSPDVSVGTGGVPIVEPTTLAGIDKDPLRRTWMRQKANVIQVSGVGFKYPVLTSRTNNAGFVAESTSTADGLPEDAANGYKPESELDWDVETGTVETIAHWVPMTRQSIVIALRFDRRSRRSYGRESLSPRSRFPAGQRHQSAAARPVQHRPAV